MAMQRIFICDERKDCTNPSCKMGGQCRLTRDSTHAAPEMQINSTMERIIISVIWRDTEKEFTE